VIYTFSTCHRTQYFYDVRLSRQRHQIPNWIKRSSEYGMWKFF